jgi:hypothetical protein
VVLILWAKTATPSDGKKARRSLRASPPFPQLLPCTSAVQQLPPRLFPPPNSKQPWPRESATSKVVDNLASPQIAQTRGCRSKNHSPKTPSRTAPVAPPFFMPPLPSQPPFPLPSTAPPSLGLTAYPLLSGYGPPIPSSQQQALPPTLPMSPANSSLNAHPNPRYASHMPPIFTEQWQCEQELAEENRKCDAQRLADSTKAKHGVVVYAWSEDGKPPTVHEFQSGFSWPFFTLVPEILSVVDLTSAGSTVRSRVQLYRSALGVWVGVDAGYVLELRAGDRIFLKASHVEDTLEFDKHLHASSKETMPHLRHNLPGERWYVRERLKEIGLGTVTSSTPSSTDDSGSEDRTVSVKKPQGRRRLSPIPFPILSNDHHLLSPKSTTSASPNTIENPPRDHKQRTKRKRTEYSPEDPSKRIHGGSDTNVLELSSDDDEPRPPSPSPSKRAARSDDAGKRWPADYLVQDIVRFFSDCSEHPQEKLHTVFHRHFPTVSFHRSTYYDNLKRWKRAKQAVRDGVMGDKWSVFIMRSRKK